jgi:hypothetical protein
MNFVIQEARASGCRTAAEADRYLEQKRKREAEESARRAKENAQVGPSSQAGPNAFMASESGGKESNSRPAVQATSTSANDLDIMGLQGADLLSESVSVQPQLCNSYSSRKHEPFGLSAIFLKIDHATKHFILCILGVKVRFLVFM